MAYRRKQVLRSSTFVEDLRPPPDDPSPPSPTSSSSSSSLAAQAIRASAAHRDSSSLSSAYGDAAFSTSYSATAAAARRDFGRQRSASFAQGSNTYEYTSMKSLNESKYGFWGILARKAKSILEDDNVSHQCQEHGGSQSQKFDTSTAGQLHQSFHSPESYQRIENPAIQRGPDSIASSLHQIGGTIRKSLEEGLTKMENRTADIIQETRKLQIRRKTGDSNAQNQATDPLAPNSLSQIQTAQETQLKASRDVRWQMWYIGLHRMTAYLSICCFR